MIFPESAPGRAAGDLAPVLAEIAGSMSLLPKHLRGRMAP
jgi:hypothetical protein